MKSLQSALLLLLFLLVTHSMQAQVPELIKKEQFRDDARAAVDSLYNFNAEGADQKLAPWKDKYPNHPLWQLMDGMEFWWVLLSDLHDTSRDEQFYEMMKRADYAASKLLYEQSGHVDALIIRTVANGYIARQHSNRDEWVTSLNAARKAYNSYGYLQDSEFVLPDLKLADGLKLYYSAYLPEAYPVVKSVAWFLPDGDKKKGLKYLDEAARTAVFARGEAAYFLGNINYNYENNYERAVRYFERLHEAYPNNNYYARLLVKNYYKMGKYDEAMAVIDESLNRWENQNLAFEDVLKEELLFWKGRILYRNRSYSNALALFKQSLQLSNKLPRSRHRNYYAASAYYAGNIHARLGRKEKAASFYQTVMDAKAGDGYRRMARNKLEDLRAAQ